MPKRGKPAWEPTSADYQRVFVEQNPWHEEKRVSPVLAKPVARPTAQMLWRRLLVDEPHRFHLVLGPRRVGKTTCLYQTVNRLLQEGVSPRHLWWIRLDHPLLMNIPLGTLVRAVLHSVDATEDAPAFLFLDELAYADKWDLWLKTFYDERWPIRVAGSSSSTAALKDRRPESGVGRWEEQYMGPYLFGEFLALVDRRVDVPLGDSLALTLRACIKARIDVSDLAIHRRRFLFVGGFPELLMGLSSAEFDDTSILLDSQRTLRNDAVERAIYKDIPQAFSIGNPLLLERLLYTLGGQLATILSPTSICQTLDRMSQPTFDRYLSYLERAFLVFTLQNYSGSEASKQKRGRKLYFVDSAVRNAALQRGIGPLNDPTEMGLLQENLVAGHVHALGQLTQVRLYHWRHDRSEVDLVYDHPDHPVALEIGSSPTHSCRGLRDFASRFPRFDKDRYLVTPQTPATLPEENRNGVGTIPLDLLLLAISAQAESALRTRLGGH